VRPTLREVLADSHIAAVAVAMFLVWSIDWGSKALLSLLVFAFEISDSVLTIALMWWHGGTISFGSRDMFFDQTLLVTTMQCLFWTVICVGAAWIISRWVYGVGPLRTLITSRARVARRDYV